MAGIAKDGNVMFFNFHPARCSAVPVHNGAFYSGGVLWLALKGITVEHSVYLAQLRPQIDDGRFVPRQIRVVSTEPRLVSVGNFRCRRKNRNRR